MDETIETMKELAQAIGTRLDELSSRLSRVESRLHPIERERDQLFEAEAKRRLGLERSNDPMCGESMEYMTRRLSRIVETRQRTAPMNESRDKE